MLSKLHVGTDEEHYLASMGVYLVNRAVLVKALDNDKTDFGKHIIPEIISRYRVCAHIFQGYWEEVGTIGPFFEANLAMCGLQPQFNLFDPEWPVYTRARFMAPSKITDSVIEQSLIADGCVIVKSRIDRSIVGFRTHIGEGCSLKHTITMGCNFFSLSPKSVGDQPLATPHLSIGAGSNIERTIIDRNAQLGEGVVITSKLGAPDFDGTNHYIRDGVVIIPRNAVIPSGTRI